MRTHPGKCLNDQVIVVLYLSWMRTLCNILQKPIQRSTLRTPPPTTLRRLLVRPVPTAKTQQLSPDIKPFDESSSSVRIKDDDDGGGEEFVCDEEPHMLTPEQGFGYYPLTLGQQLKEGKLEIVRKLGWASYSSVWLAQSLKWVTVNAWTKSRIHICYDLRDTYPVKYVAVKILTVNGTAGILNGLVGELDCLKTIKAANPNHPGFKHCPHLYDAFIAESRHGPHMCIVTNALGWNMTHLRSSSQGAFPVALSKRIIKQTLLALDYLHRECGLVHTGKPFASSLRFKIIT